MAENTQYFTVKLVRSLIGAHKTHRETLAGLGLKHINQVVTRKDIPSVRGMLYKVSHWIELTKATEVVASARQQRREHRAKAEA